MSDLQDIPPSLEVWACPCGYQNTGFVCSKCLTLRRGKPSAEARLSVLLKASDALLATTEPLDDECDDPEGVIATVDAEAVERLREAVTEARKP